MVSTEADAVARPDRQSQVRMLLMELSASFINLQPDQVDAAIENAQRRICESLDLDRSSLWQQPAGEPASLVLTHVYQRRVVLPRPTRMDAATLCPWVLEQLRQGKAIALSSLDDLPPEASREKEFFRQYSTKSTVIVPLLIGEAALGALGFASATQEQDWPEGLVRWLQLIGQIFANAIARARGDKALHESQEQLRKAYEEVRQLRDQLHQQNTYLRQEVRMLKGDTRLVGQSPALQRVLAQVEQVAGTTCTVLLLGETGTGKEVVASAIHELSPRRDRPMVRVNCSAIPVSLIESELFGREKGAYTGALSKQVGRFEMAHGSTLFLDEIGDLPCDVQVRLLRVLQERQIERLGSPKPISVDVRIVAATNQDLATAVREGRFRQDLYYRLNVFPIKLPPLRDRREDIAPLVSAFVSEFAAALGKNIEAIARESMEALERYRWPGNVRELRNVIERAMIVATGHTLWIDLPDAVSSASIPCLSIRENECQLIRNVLEMTGWRIRGRNGAAEILGLKPTTLESRMAKLGISRGARDGKR